MGKGEADPLTWDTPRKILEDIALRCGSLRALGEQSGRSGMWLWRQLRENKGLDLSKVYQVLGTMEVPPRFYFEELLETLPGYDPTWVLAHFREGTGSARDPFLAASYERLARQLESLEVTRNVGRRRTAEIEALEEQTFFDRMAAKKGLEALGIELIEALETPSPGSSIAGLLGDIAHALTVWGSIQRIRGNRDDSVDAYVLAFRLATLSQDPKVIGYFYYYAAMLLPELGQPGHALRFADECCTLFQQFRDRDHLARGMVQTGIVEFDLERFAAARHQAICALRPSIPRCLANPRRCLAAFGEPRAQPRQVSKRIGQLRSRQESFTRLGICKGSRNLARSYCLRSTGPLTESGKVLSASPRLV